MEENNINCPYLHSGLHVWTDGTVSPCCDYEGKLFNSNGEEFKIQNNHLNEIFNSSHMNELRKNFKNKEIPTGCNKCFEREKLGLQSRRTMAAYRLENIINKINYDGDNPIRYIGAHPTNHCNLSCRICNSDFSSVIETEDKKNGISTNKKDRPVNELYNQISDLNELCNFEILGGEPFLVKNHIEYMKKIINSGVSKHSIFQFTTNGTIFPDFFNEKFEFKRLEITFSIDDIGPRFEYQRNGAKWEQVNENIKKFREFRSKNKNVKLNVCVTINILNVYYLNELMDWFKKSKLNNIFFNILKDPEYLSIENLTENGKILVNQKLNKTFSPVKEILMKSTNSDGIKFIENIKIRDKIRNQNIMDHHGEIALAMGFIN